MNEPPWRALLDVLDRTLSDAPATAEERRYSWSIRRIHERLEIELWHQIAGKRGRFGQRRRVSPQLILEGLDPPELEADRRALKLLEEELDRNQWEGSPSRLAKISEATARRLVVALAGHPRLFCPQTVRGHDDGIPLQVETDRLALSATEDLHGGIHLSPVLEKSGRPRPDLMELCTRRIPANIIIELDEEAGLCRAIELTAEARRTFHSLRGRLVSFPQEARLEVLQRLPKLASQLPVLRDRALTGTKIPAGPAILLRLGPLGVDSIRASILIEPAPGVAAVVPGAGSAEMYGMSKTGALVWTQRDLRAEKSAANQLIDGLPPLARNAKPEATVVDVTGDDALELIGELERNPELRTEWIDGTWRPKIKRGEASQLRLSIRDHRDWFSIDGGIDVGAEQLHLAALLEAVRNDQRHLKLSGDEWLAIGESLAAQLRRIEDLSFEEDKVSLTAPLVLSDLQNAIGKLITSPKWRRALANSERADFASPPDFRGELRAYQLEGFRWMSRLAELELGACLADDMGLGKTIQAIAMLSARAALGPALVIAPTSVGFNWIRELAQFAPKLRGVPLQKTPPDQRRALLEKLGAGDVVIISYELALRDIETLEAVTFGTLILDEAQAVKNADTDRARAVRRIDARWRLAMSGTPVENNAGELWSLFRILSPGLLGSWDQFRRRFLLPFEKETGAERRRALARILKPFILRRTKEEVAPELPPKTEIDVEVMLSPLERQRYHEARTAALAQVSESVKLAPIAQQRFVVLAAITRLRQLACHPALIDHEWTASSAKIETAIALLEELRSEGHRALVFSQFTALLDLFEAALKRAEISFVRLDGQTPSAQRGAIVSEFQTGRATAFLLSLKAGGTGLNLTAADYVLHLDPWWNPAAEDQATDRAHRIGQTKPLTVYRLISKATIEEQILAVHAEKRALMRELLEGTDSAAKLDTGELISLIQRSAETPENWDI